MTENNSDYVKKWIESLEDPLIEISQEIWNFAELGFREFKSSKLLTNSLKEHGFNVQMGVASLPTAFVAEYGSGMPVVGVLGEYDALPGLSQAAEPFKKPITENAPGHGCGHNLLATGTLGAALAIKKAIDIGLVKGTIRYYGCPAEEIFAAKAYMINPGHLFDDADIILAWHPQAFNTVRLSKNYAINSALFKFHGKTANAAEDPYNGRSALDAIELTNIASNYMREHVIPEARLHYAILNGGEAPNVVPDLAEGYYSIRAPERHQVEEIYGRLVKIGKGAELMTGTNLEIEFLDGTHDQIRNQVVSNIIYEKMNEIGPPKFRKEEKRFAKEIKKTFPQDALNGIKKGVPPHLQEVAKIVFNSSLCPMILPPTGKGDVSFGCTDVGDVSWNVPLGEFWMACLAMGGSTHSWQTAATSGMSIGHKGMLNAAKVITLSALEFMSNQELVQKAHQELKQCLKGRVYKSPFPEGFKPPIHRSELLMVR